ncbi:MAG: TlpA family protein disulfide reductase [Marinilabiliales bacterium]|nr:MAG: TlpA family protein disulfide reductase [Marinilabiliales bacterium]
MRIIRFAALAALVIILALWLTGRKNGTTGTSPENAATVQPTGNTGNRIGDTAPDIELLTPDGETVTLSSLRGNVVMLDFWASWCGPCRRSNPAKVEAWERFRDKEFVNGSGFSLFSVSLDTNRESWIKGIEDDNLGWDHHVSDLLGWSSETAALYQVRSIPASWLIDGNGMIIARNLRGDDISEALTGLLTGQDAVTLNNL